MTRRNAAVFALGVVCVPPLLAFSLCAAVFEIVNDEVRRRFA